jgi:hypothetical protein
VGPPPRSRPDYIGGIDLTLRLSSQFSAVAQEHHADGPHPDGGTAGAAVHEPEPAEQVALSRHASGGWAGSDDDQDNPWLGVAADVEQNWNGACVYESHQSTRWHLRERGDRCVSSARVPSVGQKTASDGGDVE